MQSRRDQVQAQSYVWSRLVTALVVADADAAENPNRRFVVGTLCGLLVAALVVGGFAVYGFLRPGGASSWRKPGALVVEKESGSRYLFVDNRLRPVLNYASARLMSPQPPPVVSVSRRSLDEVPRGQPIGIVGAPDALPSPGQVAAQTWTVCAASAVDPTGRTATATTLAIGPESAAGRPLGPDEAVLAVAGESRFLLWRGYRLRLATDWLPRVLGADGPGAPVEDNWLETVPAGPDLAPVEAPGRGKPGPRIDGRDTKIGQVFTARDGNGTERHYLLQQDGLTALGPLAYAMVTGDPATAKLYGGGPVSPAPISLAALAGTPTSSRTALPAGIPPELPRVLAAPPPGTTWCARHRMADGTVQFAADAAVGTSGIVTDGLSARRTSRTAAAVAVEPGQGGLVVSGRFGQALGASRFLITDAGVKFPVSDADSAARLGFPPSDARPVPPRLLELLPDGPALGTAMVLG